MKKQILISISFLISAMASQVLLAATIKVCPTGCAYTTITDGVAAASAGDTLAIGNGTYFEHDIVIDKPLKLSGQSQQKVVIDAQRNGRHFEITRDSISVSIENMRLLRGDATSGPTGVTTCSSSIGADGGSICSKGTSLYLNKLTFEDNKANDIGSGGAVYFYGVDINGKESRGLNIVNSEFFNNMTDRYGGAVFSFRSSNVSIKHSVFRSNSASEFGGAINVSSTDYFVSESNLYEKNLSGTRGGAVSTGNARLSKHSYISDTFSFNQANYGGAIYNAGNSGMSVRRSTFNGNKAAYGGAINNRWSPLLVQNSTFSSNYAEIRGAAIRSYYSTELFLNNSTFVANTSDTERVGNLIAGGVVYLVNSNNHVYRNEISNSLFFNNGANECSLFPFVTINGVNNLTDSSSCEQIGYTNMAAGYVGLPFSFGSATNVAPTLANNGGETSTHAITQFSNAVDAGAVGCVTPDNNTPITQDQRGKARIKYCDIGAYEFQ